MSLFLPTVFHPEEVYS